MSGDKADAEEKLRKAAAQNSPAQLKKFAKTAEPIIGALDADTARSLHEVMAILTEGAPAGAAESAPRTAKTVEKDASRNAGALKTNGFVGDAVDAHAFRTGMIVPAFEERASPCSSADADARCRRARALEGPFVITNVFASGGCPDELAIFAASNATHPKWMLLAPAKEHLNVAGHFVVEEGDFLYASARTTLDFNKDARCAIVWSGYRPNNP
ncbi:hypothetical protein AKJ09_01760 [Labilithrix luteola]|uniref:Uncharacterized protein n=1 Tax=Labilithrix luteola TaxID=1391654 RepID=A0A0K1PNV5_9BACT|nr:hypothetical protein AKJ09_01760 [Labilithrix luteola]